MQQQKSNGPATVGAVGGTSDVTQHHEDTAVTAAALILPWPATTGNRHIVTMRRATAPRHGRDWLATFDSSREFSIRAGQLRNPARFLRVAANALRRERHLDDVVIFPHDWRDWIDGAIERIGGVR